MTRVCGGVDISLLLNQPVPSYQGLVSMADYASVAGAAGVASMAGERVQKRIIHVVFNPSLIRAGRISVCLLPALILVCSFLFQACDFFPAIVSFLRRLFVPFSQASPVQALAKELQQFAKRHSKEFILLIRIAKATLSFKIGIKPSTDYGEETNFDRADSRAHICGWAWLVSHKMPCEQTTATPTRGLED